MCRNVQGFELAHPLDMQEEWSRSHTGDPKALLQEIIFVSDYLIPSSGRTWFWKVLCSFFTHLLSHIQFFNLEQLLTFCASVVDK